MKQFTILFLLFITNQVFGQKKLFEDLKIDASTKIIGRYPQYDKSKSYEMYNFIIEDSAKIVAFIKNLSLGDEVENSLEDPNFKLTVVKNYDEIGSWTINPSLKSAMTHDGHTYQFNLQQIAKLNKTYPFKYTFKVKEFNNKNAYEAYVLTQKKNPNFLFDYRPLFKYEGSFEIQFPKNERFPHPKAISELLVPYIEKIVKKGEYTLGYKISQKNMNNRNQYTMTIEGSKILFQQLKFENLKIENWIPTVEQAYFFYKQ